jgi:serine/threonine protein phosphatase 1
MLSSLRLSLWPKRADKIDVKPPSPPENMVLYAVGDIHGELALLNALLADIADDFARHGQGASPIIIYIGDYVDRGPDSAGVVDLLLGDPMPGFRQHWLLGNHDAAMLDFLRDPGRGADWLELGGLATLRSYGVDPAFGGLKADRLSLLRDALAERIPAAHVTFLAALEPVVVYGDYAFVHAGIRPGRLLADQTLEDLLWIRSPFLEAGRHYEKIIVHGHTIVPEIEVLPNRIAIDTGAFSTGKLSAVALQGGEVRRLEMRRARVASPFQPAQPL